MECVALLQQITETDNDNDNYLKPKIIKNDLFQAKYFTGINDTVLHLYKFVSFKKSSSKSKFSINLQFYRLVESKTTGYD